MSSRSIQISVFFLTLLLSACYPTPDFSDTPAIKYNSLKYINYENDRDSLILKFNFEDGDGDIGLDAEELNPPYHPFNFIIDSRDSLVTYSDPAVKPPLYAVDADNHVSFFSNEDNRTPYNCSDYYIYEYSNGTSDTFYIQSNEFHNNFHIDFLRKRNGVYTSIDFAAEFGNTSCDVVNFNGRIPVFNEENLGKSLSGSISYSMFSAGFPIILRQDTFKLKFYIYDLALNKSNEAETPDFTLKDITVNR